MKKKVLSFLALGFFMLSACTPKPNSKEKNMENLQNQVNADEAQTVTGTWGWSGENESGGYLKTIQRGNKVQFQLEIYRGAPSYNSGSIDGEFDINGSTGAFNSTEFGVCEILFDFQKSKVVLTQPSDKTDCGFGHGVYPDGTYPLSSNDTPEFSVGDPREH
jgi:hypothetical protein